MSHLTELTDGIKLLKIIQPSRAEKLQEIKDNYERALNMLAHLVQHNWLGDTVGKNVENIIARAL
jgi:hypothetical protein